MRELLRRLREDDDGEEGRRESKQQRRPNHTSRLPLLPGPGQLITCRFAACRLAKCTARRGRHSSSSANGFRWCGEGVVCSHDDDSTSEHARARAQTTVIIVLTYADDAFPSTLLAVLTRRSSSPRTLRLFLLSLV